MIDLWALGTGAVLGGSIGMLTVGLLTSQKVEAAEAMAWRIVRETRGTCQRQSDNFKWETRELRAELARVRAQRSTYLHEVMALTHQVAQLKASQDQTIRVPEVATGEAVTEETMRAELEKVGVAT